MIVKQQSVHTDEGPNFKVSFNFPNNMHIFIPGIVLIATTDKMHERTGCMKEPGFLKINRGSGITLGVFRCFSF